MVGYGFFVVEDGGLIVVVIIEVGVRVGRMRGSNGWYVVDVYDY